MVTMTGVPVSSVSTWPRSAPTRALPSEQRLRGGRAEADHELGSHGCELEPEPVAAGLDLRPARLVVDAPLSAGTARAPLEVLHRIREVGVLRGYPHLLEHLAEQRPGRADEGLPGAVLDVTRLLADEHQRALRALAEDDLGAELPEVATPATLCLLAQLLDRRRHGSPIPAGAGSRHSSGCAGAPDPPGAKEREQRLLLAAGVLSSRRRGPAARDRGTRLRASGPRATARRRPGSRTRNAPRSRCSRAPRRRVA